MERRQHVSHSCGGRKACQCCSWTSNTRSRSAWDSGKGWHVGVELSRSEPRSGCKSRQKVATMKSLSPGPVEVQDCAVAAKSGEAMAASMGAGERWWPPEAATARLASERS
eukprot:15162025-Alexandrium_andersonii.AAC.1